MESESAAAEELVRPESEVEFWAEAYLFRQSSAHLQLKAFA